MIFSGNITTLNLFILFFGVFFGAGEEVAVTQSPVTCDTVSFQDESISLNDIPEHSVSFYRKDSIFSLRSPKGYLPSLVHNIGEQAAAPFHFSKKDWLYTGAVAGVTTALIFLADEDIDEWARVQKANHKWVRASSPVISEFGSNYAIYTIIGSGLISAAFNKEKGVQTSLLASQAFITSGIWVQVIKLLTGRERPKASYIVSKIEGGKWHGPLSRFLDKNPDSKSGFNYDAFPSGHTATAFSIATVFALQYRDKKAIPIICYTAATAVGISRLTEHEHWASDVFLGAVIGYLSGKQVVNHFNKTHQGPLVDKPSRIKKEIVFFQEGNRIGFSIKW